MGRLGGQTDRRESREIIKRVRVVVASLEASLQRTRDSHEHCIHYLVF